jgi:DedD protein
MANQQAMSDEETQLRRRARRRLIGAVTLVTVMVVTLPMVLDGEPKQSGQDIAINIPSPASSGDFSSKIVPVPEQAKADAPAPADKPAPAAVPDKVAPVLPPEKAQPAAAEKVAEAKVEQPAPKKTAEAKAEMVPAKKEEKPADKPKEVADTAKETKPATKPAEAQHASGSHIILLGAFLSESNAKQRQAKLKEIGVKFYLEKIKSPAGEKTAVRAGPYSSRQEAERILGKLKAAGITDGIVAEKKG